ncbi:MAG TPA: cell division protein FtsX [Bacteroidales bacterium]|nr:cell division protein FtsX [Bacteroidales bacterium]
MSLKEEAIIGRRLKTSYITTVASIALVLFVMGLVGLLVLNSQMLSVRIKENLGFTILLNEGTQQAEISTLEATLITMPAVKSIEFISSDEAAAILQEELGEDFVAFLGYNPLFPSLEVRMHATYANPDSLKVFEEEILQNNLVREVHYPQDLVALINENARILGGSLIAFSALLLVVAIILINNTIRLSIYSKRFLIKSMQLVGATGAFIRKPFITKGLTQGLIGSIVAILLLFGVLYIASMHIPGLWEIQDATILVILACSILITGLLISWVSTFFAVRKYLNLKTDHLY